MMKEKIDNTAIELFRQLNRAKVKTCLLRVMAQASYCGYDLAIFNKRLGWKPGKIEKIVAGEDFTLDQVSDILFAFCGEVLTYDVEHLQPVEYDFGVEETP